MSASSRTLLADPGNLPPFIQGRARLSQVYQTTYASQLDE